jgi:RNAse (barnase) inhibitor barstar
MLQKVVIDCSRVTSEADFWTAYVDAVRPRDGHLFGRNLDALRDALTAGGPGWPGECELRFTHTRTLATLSGGALLAALREVAESSSFVRVVLD